VILRRWCGQSKHAPNVPDAAISSLGCCWASLTCLHGGRVTSQVWDDRDPTSEARLAGPPAAMLSFTARLVRRHRPLTSVLISASPFDAGFSQYESYHLVSTVTRWRSAPGDVEEYRGYPNPDVLNRGRKVSWIECRMATWTIMKLWPKRKRIPG
jgi:hypothetical protein